LFSDRTDSVLILLFRYAIVGGLAFAADLGSLIALTELAGWHYLASTAAGSVVGLVVNYSLSVLWVFNERTVGNRSAEFLVFTVLGVIGLGVNELVLFLLTGLAGVHYVASKVVATGLTFAWNFVSRKVLLFTTTLARPAREVSPVGHINTGRMVR
jgi:putative flippase GtrA